MNIISEVNEYIKSRADFFSPISLDMFLTNGDELMCRNDPAAFKETSYLDGSSIGKARFTYYAKSLDAKKAIGELDKILLLLNLPETEISGGLYIKCEPVTQVTFVSKYQSGEFVYLCTISLEFERSS
jgi:hypothetical protein